MDENQNTFIYNSFPSTARYCIKLNKKILLTKIKIVILQGNYMFYLVIKAKNSLGNFYRQDLLKEF